MDLLHKWVQIEDFERETTYYCNHGLCSSTVPDGMKWLGMCKKHMSLYWEQQLTWLGKKLLRGARKPKLEFDFNKNPPQPETWKS